MKKLAFSFKTPPNGKKKELGGECPYEKVDIEANVGRDFLLISGRRCKSHGLIALTCCITMFLVIKFCMWSNPGDNPACQRSVEEIGNAPNAEHTVLAGICLGTILMVGLAVLDLCCIVCVFVITIRYRKVHNTCNRQERMDTYVFSVTTTLFWLSVASIALFGVSFALWKLWFD